MKAVMMVVLVVALIGSGWWFMQGQGAAPAMTPADSTTLTGTGNDAMDTAAPNTVEIKDFAFGPGTMTVKVGTTVTWTNKDTASHTATADDGSFDTGLLATGESGTFTFTKAGTFTYHCTPHPNMKGTVVVEE